MLLVVLKKMLRNKWLVICLLVGLVFTVALLGSIPMYTQGILQRVLTKDLENMQAYEDVYPGRYYAAISFNTKQSNDICKNYQDTMDRLIDEEYYPNLNVDTICEADTITLTGMKLTPENPNDTASQEVVMVFTLKAMSNLKDHITLLSGRMASDQKMEEGSLYDYEVLVNSDTYISKRLRLNEIYTVESTSSYFTTPIRVKVTGVFEYSDPESEYAQNPAVANISDAIYMDYDLFLAEFQGQGITGFAQYEKYKAMDYYSITIPNVNNIVEVYEEQRNALNNMVGDAIGVNLTLEMPNEETLASYGPRSAELELMLTVLQVPIYVILVFYLIMVARLIVNNDKDEIAVLKSRGCSRWQIFTKYLMENGILCLIAAILGPLLAYFVCKVLGASNGFLEFVDRRALPVQISWNVVFYILIALVASLIMVLIPAFAASKTSIVARKRAKGTVAKNPFWQRYFLDIVLLAFSIYVYYSRTQVEAGESALFQNDILMYVISTAFILGLGLFILRLYPLLVALVFKITKKLLPAVPYLALNQVAKGSQQNKFVMIFLIMMMATGIFSANAARTINENLDQQKQYEVGAPVTAYEYWDLIEVGYDENGESIYAEDEPVRTYNITGLSNMTRVIQYPMTTLQKTNSEIHSGTRGMAIEPYKFGSMVWWKAGLAEHDINEYLNILMQNEDGILLSSAYRDLGYNVGDYVTATLGIDQTTAQFRVCGFFDLWPTYYPDQDPYMVVVNYEYVRANLPVAHYELWFDRDEDVETEEIYQSIEDQGLRFTSLTNLKQELISIRNDPTVQGTNGALTLSFLITMIISIIGFLIFWILSIRERMLQFGILRALGLRMSGVLKILGIEQLLISFSAVIFGIIIGYFNSQMFIPFLQYVYTEPNTIPEFSVYSTAADYVKLYVLAGIMLLIGLFVLFGIIRKINAAQTLKMGED